MTGPRELTALQAFRDLRQLGPSEQSASALMSLAVSLAALADLYELELSCMSNPECEQDAEDASEAHPS